MILWKILLYIKRMKTYKYDVTHKKACLDKLTTKHWPITLWPRQSLIKSHGPCYARKDDKGIKIQPNGFKIFVMKTFNNVMYCKKGSIQFSIKCCCYCYENSFNFCMKIHVVFIRASTERKVQKIIRF